MIWSIFIVGAILIIILQLWYIGLQKPLSKKEIDTHLAYLEKHTQKHTEIDVIKQFMLEDDGKEICMANFVSLHEGNITHPTTGQKVDAYTLVQDYMKALLGIAAKNACHPLYLAYKKGGHIDSWGSDEALDFRGLQMMRYRSRRDFVELLQHPNLERGLAIKFAAIAKTITFPVQIQFSTFLRPNIWLSLIIVVICCVLQIAFTL